MGTRGEDWTDKEMLRTLLYYASGSSWGKGSSPFSELCNQMPERSPGSIVFRMLNYVARDPKAQEKGTRGMVGGGKKVDLLWERFSDESGNLNLSALLREASTKL